MNDPEFRPHIRRFYHLNGEILLLLNRPEDAALNFQATLKVYDHPLYRESMARAKWQSGDLEGAIAEMERLVALTDARLDIPIHYVKAHYQLGQLHEQQGDRDRARDWYRRFLDFWGSSDLDLEEIREARKKDRRIIIAVLNSPPAQSFCRERPECLRSRPRQALPVVRLLPFKIRSISHARVRARRVHPG